MAKSNKAKPLPEKSPVDDWHTQLVEWVNSSDDDTQESRELAEKSRDYYDSKQWQADEVAKLKKQKQAATVRNRIKPKMDGLMGMERANRTTAKAYPRTPKHDKGATAATEAVRFVLDDNAYHQKRSAAWDNLLVEGTGGYEVIAEEGKDEMKIVINQILWDRIIYDPYCRSKIITEKTSRFAGQVKWLDYDVAKTKFPKGVDVLETMISGSETYDDKPRWMDGTRDRVKVVELYYSRPDGKLWYSCFTRGGYLGEPKVSPYVNEEGETEWPYEFGSLFVDRDGNRYGGCKQLLDIQDEINKRGSKALHLMSVRQIMLEKGAVDDVNKTRAELAKPDGVVEVTPGMLLEVLKTNDMAAAQFNLLAEAKAEIDAVSYNAAAAGKDTRNMSGVALRNREVAGQTEVAPMFDVLKSLDIRVYRKVWHRVKQYWKKEKWIRVTDDPNNLKWVGLNAPITRGQQLLQEAQEKGAPPQILQQLQQKLSTDPMMQQVVETENDIAVLDVDIVMADAPDTVTQQIEDFTTLGEMVKSGFPMPPIAVIEASPLSNKDKIIKMMKESPQLPPEVEEKMKKMQEEGKKLAEENQALKQDTQSEQAKLQLSAQEAQAKLQQRQAEAQAELQLKAETQAAEIQLERERAAATIALEREKAQAQLELQAMKQQGDQQHQSAQLEFDQKCRMEDEQHNTKVENVAESDKMMPKVISMLEEIVASQQEFQKELLEQQSKTKKVTLARPGHPTLTAVVN